MRIRCRHDEVERRRARSQIRALRSIGRAVEADITRVDGEPTPPGMAIHECGTARMGTSPHNSVLDADNQCWDAWKLYVTDGACFPSQGTQNPTLTIMALTARACHHALASG